MSKFNVARGLSNQRGPPTSNFSFNAALRQAICLAPQNSSPRGCAVRCVGVALSQGKFSPGIIWEFFNLGFDHIQIDTDNFRALPPFPLPPPPGENTHADNS